MLDIGSRLELFVDHYLIDRLTGTQLKLHPPRPAESVFTPDKPWETGHAGYFTIIKDGATFRMYYRGLSDERNDPSRSVPDSGPGEITCYAQSPDGINWTRPNLGLFEERGTKDNNIILADDTPYLHNFCPFLDTRPGIPDDQRYKALGGCNAEKGLAAFVSADAVHWQRLQGEPVFNDTGWVFDSQNVSFWSQAENCYVLYYRKAPEKARSIARATSKDFVNWSEPVMMYFDHHPPTKTEQLYINQTHPYFRAPHIYIATPARFMAGRHALTADLMEQGGIDPDSWLGKDCSDAVFMTSRGGNQYDRTFLEAFIRPGIGPRNWTSRTNYPALGIVQTGPTEMSMYVTRHNAQPSYFLQRLTLRLDGFVSVNAPYRGGEMVTNPLAFAGKKLVLNFGTSAAGSMRVEIQNEQGRPIDGYAMDDCKPIIGDQIERVVEWTAGADVSKLAGQAVRLRFLMKDADLYSMQFRD